MRCIQFEQEKEYIDAFLKLPKSLYSVKNNTENPNEVHKFLLGTHPLSKYFTLQKFLVLRGKEVVGRFAITLYPGDHAAYLGFFECIRDMEVAEFLFREATNYGKKMGCTKLLGPVDGSFWNKYRLKINLFEKEPYTGEPYNLPYYQELFLENGFQVCEHYTSNIYSRVDTAEPLYDERYEKFLEKGYKIVSPSVSDFDTVIEQLYELITDLYSDFPIYKQVAYEDFAEIFSDYRHILKEDMVKMAYFEERPVGFFISVPDYGNSVYHLRNPLNLLKVLKIRRKPQAYVMLYMGVHKEHQGLGKALVGSIMEVLRRNGLPSIGALARDGKITQDYGKEHIKERYEYVLLEKNLLPVEGRFG